MLSNHNQYVSDFLNFTQHPLVHLAEEVRELILSADAEISEHIKRNAPSYVYEGEDRITFNLRRSDQILILFHRGVKKKDSTNFVFDDKWMLQWLDKDRGMIVIKTQQDIQPDLLSDLVRRRIHI